MTVSADDPIFALATVVALAALTAGVAIVRSRKRRHWAANTALLVLVTALALAAGFVMFLLIALNHCCT